MLDGVFRSPVDAYFETVSGLTTTGSTALVGIESAMGMAMHFWRMETHWIGGMGIMVLFVAVLPSLGVGGKMLFKNEVPGPITEGVKPRIRETSIALWKIYIGLTVLQTLLLMGAGGLDLHAASGHAMSTLGTGGFSTLNNSVAGFSNPMVHWIIAAFMFLGGANFSLFFYALRGDRGVIWRDPEFRVYLAIVVFSSLAVAATIAQRHAGEWEPTLRHAFFQVLSVLTTTGFMTDDFDEYPTFPRTLIFGLMFIGACTGSTAGGIKVFRYVVLMKVFREQMHKLVRPAAVSVIKIGQTSISQETLSTVLAYFFVYMGTFALGTLVMATMSPDLETAASVTIASLGNIGPGLSAAGAVESLAWVPPGGKLILAALMILGRLELYTVLVLLAPSFWRR
jgi:trk system potassium uptake protein TrkH